MPEIILRKKVLIVEDQFLIAYDLKQILESNGFEVFNIVSTFEEAIELLQTIPLDLALLDIVLKSNKTGLDIGVYINQTIKIPFIYITAFHDQQTLIDVVQTKPSGFIAKPFKPIDVIAAVNLAILKTEQIFSLTSTNDLEYENDRIPYRIKKVIQYIDEHINERIEIDTLAQLTTWHKQHFIRIFQKTINSTPYQYILNKKIEKSCEMILSTDCSCSSIAFEFGFLSYSNFNKAFKKTKGFTPEQFRQKFK